MRSEQTVAKTGRRMKKSTNISPWRHLGPVDQFLQAGDDRAIARFQALLHHVRLPDDRAELDGKAARDQPAVLIHRHEHERLAAEAGDRGDRQKRRLAPAPDDPRAQELVGAQRGLWILQLALDQDRLGGVVDPRRDEGDRRARHRLAVRIEELDGEPEREVGGALDRDADVDLEVLVLVEGGEHGLGGDRFADPHRDVADHAGLGRVDQEVAERDLLLAHLLHPARSSSACALSSAARA